jgi:SNF2 family DNA or RNA helicase
MKRDFILAYEAGEIMAVNAAVQINKLLQISNGCIYTEEGYELTHSKKVEALVEIADTSTEPLLVAYNFKSDLAEIKKAIPKAVVLDKNPKTIDKWNRGEIPVMLCHPASAGHGLNLQKGGSVIVWFGLTWSLELYQQFNARLHRQGQTKPVRVIHILSKDTADTRVLDTLMQKEDGQNALLDFVKGLKTTKS